jgi:predicted DNA-binding protein
MKKTSVYLSEEDVRRLGLLARDEGRSQAEIIRRAIASYVPERKPDRNFAMDGVGEGPGDSIADIPEEEYLKGFGR